MISTRIEELMWKSIDGTITDREKNQLQSHLDEHPEARAYFGELKSFNELLEGVSEVEPPEVLHQRILAGLERVPAPSPSRTRSPESRPFKSILGIRWNLRLAVSAALGCLVGIIGYHLANNKSLEERQLDISKIYGTMSIGQDTEYGTVPIEVEGVEGTLKFRRENDVVVSELNVFSDDEVEITFEHAGGDIRSGGLDPAGDSRNRVTVESGGVSLVNTGDGHYFLAIQLVDHTSPPLTLRVSRGDRVLLEKLIDLDDIPNDARD